MTNLNERQFAALRALASLETDRHQPLDAWTSQDIGTAMRLPRVRRAGNGAVKGSWSGYVAAGFSLAPTMEALVRRELVRKRDSGRARRVASYRMTEAGEEVLAQAEPDRRPADEDAASRQWERFDAR